jgi:chloride channel 3/4/5
MSHSDENSPLLSSHRLGRLIQQDEEASSFVKSHVSVDEQALASSTVGERLAYNDYTTIDWLHDLVSAHVSSHLAPIHVF